MTTFRVGVSGFSYPSWKGRFHPEDMKSEDFLPYYSKRLNSVEINSSFYALPGAPVVKGWSAKTGGGFVFSFKAPKLITHVLKLGEGAPQATEKLSKTLDILEGKRGPVLFQLPPFSRANHELLEKFLSSTDAVRQRVFEFRHESWFVDSTYQLLDDHGAGFCVAESEDARPRLKATGGIAYFRLRNEAYGDDGIAGWATKISKVSQGLDQSYVYLRHDETGQNGLLAAKLSQKLNKGG